MAPRRAGLTTRASASTQNDTQTAASMANSRTLPYYWTGPAELFLIEQMITAIKDGERAENHFNPRVWDRIIIAFANEGLAPVRKDQLLNKHDTVRPSCAGSIC
jgi:hypothetical protein